MSDRVVQDIIPRTHAKISIKYLLGRGKTILNTSDEVKQYIQETLNEALRTTIMEVEIWINYHVAMDTGALRESLIEFLRKSIPPSATIGELRGIRLILGVGAEIYYAKYVNKMPMSKVRHAIDPRAYGYYHDKMVEFAKERLRINVDKARYKVSTGG
ncbi:hypothetical protein LCGC14_0708650 [marine sediment metagenome]|uniref:Uncharacterized protein n=1 Tax=marine sediment metagenome TaxID=412755 RepID=A0A0F9T1L0_9ZZZZ